MDVRRLWKQKLFTNGGENGSLTFFTVIEENGYKKLYIMSIT